MKTFAAFIAGALAYALISVAHATWMPDSVKQDRDGYRAYVACRDKNPKVVTYECLRLNTLGFQQL